jgi:hypothetical protein
MKFPSLPQTGQAASRPSSIFFMLKIIAIKFSCNKTFGKKKK